MWAKCSNSEQLNTKWNSSLLFAKNKWKILGLGINYTLPLNSEGGGKKIMLSNITAAKKLAWWHVERNKGWRVDCLSTMWPWRFCRECKLHKILSQLLGEIVSRLLNLLNIHVFASSRAESSRPQFICWKTPNLSIHTMVQPALLSVMRSQWTMAKSTYWHGWHGESTHCLPSQYNSTTTYASIRTIPFEMVIVNLPYSNYTPRYCECPCQTIFGQALKAVFRMISTTTKEATNINDIW